MMMLSPSFAQGVDRESAGFLDFNYYRDSRSHNTFTTNILADEKNTYQYFLLVDFYSDHLQKENTDSDFYYSEQNLRVPLAQDSPL